MASGTDSDPNGDTGTWSYTLTVTPGTLVEIINTSGTTTPEAAPTFTDQIQMSGGVGPLTYTVTEGGAPWLAVSASGQVTTTSQMDTGEYAGSTGVYAVSGTVTDAYGDTGTWCYGLSVNAT